MGGGSSSPNSGTETKRAGTFGSYSMNKGGPAEPSDSFKPIEMFIKSMEIVLE